MRKSVHYSLAPAALAFAALLIILPSPAEAQTGRTISIRIESELSPDQGQEFTFITLGNDVQLLVLDAESPYAAAEFMLPGPGTYLCFLHALTDLEMDGRRLDAIGHGALQIEVTGGEVFALEADFSRYEERGAFLIGLRRTGTMRFDDPSPGWLRR